jgi:uncharacterized membrane protein
MNSRASATGRVVTGIALGAGLMYFLDPDRGRRRRAMLRDQAVHAAHQAADAAGATSSDLQNRLYGMGAELRSWFREEEVSDEVLSARVRSVIGTVVSHPGSIRVTVRDGHVLLEGPVLAREVRRLLKRVARVRSVIDVEDHLEVHQHPGDIPGLQGEAVRRSSGGRFELLQTYWSPAGRFLAGLGGGAMTASGALMRGIPGLALGAAGVALLARAATNMELKRLVGVGAGARAIDIQKTVHIDAPIDHVFRLWIEPENFPHFMSHVREVRAIGEGRSHWVVSGPAGARFEWDAVTTKFVQNEEIAWRTEPGSAIAHSGVVRFEPEGHSRTRVDVKLTYNPVAGGIGHAVAALLGADPKHRMDDDLMRMKSFVETGILPHDAAQRTQEPPGGEEQTVVH